MNLRALARIVVSNLGKVKRGPVALTFHHVSDIHHPWIEQFFRELSRTHTFVDPKQVLLRNTLPTNSVIVTFDDGLKSQLRVVEEVLEPLGIKAALFVPTYFIGLTGSDAFQFVCQKFFPLGTPGDSSPGAYDAMSWSDLRRLWSRGHMIGAHTHTHPKLSHLEVKQQTKEIVDSADLLSEKLGCEIRQFAYPFGSVSSVNESALSIARDRFDVCYSNVRGMLSEESPDFFMCRQNIVPSMPVSLGLAAVRGKLDWRHYKARKLALAKY